MDKKEKQKELLEQVTQILNEWDFLGSAAAGPQDEYDCLAGPLTTLLAQGSDKKQMKTFIESEIKDHFGLGEDGYSKNDLEKTLDKLAALAQSD